MEDKSFLLQWFILFKIIFSFIPFHFILVIFAVGISVPSIFCILKFLLIQVYLRSGTLIGLLLWLYSFLTPLDGIACSKWVGLPQTNCPKFINVTI